MCSCMLVATMLFYDLLYGEVINAIILGIVGFLMMVIGAIRNNRCYVILATITLIILVFYITRDFWLSIAWWVYLFVAGLFMIALAVKEEKEGA